MTSSRYLSLPADQESEIYPGKVVEKRVKMSANGIRMSPIGLAAVAVLAVFIFYQITIRVFEPHDKVSLKSLLIAGIDVAERGGDQVREIRFSSELKQESKGKTREGANDPLTLGDRLSHQAMSRSFGRKFPYIKLISEESDGKPVDMQIDPLSENNPDVSSQIPEEEDEIVNSDDVTVWIDPLDATQEYTENLTQYVTTMFCVAVQGRPVIGIIHKPFTKQTFWGWVGHGANVKKQNVGNEDEIRIIVSRSHAGRVKDTAQKAFGEGVTVVPAGGAGFKSLALYDGKASVYIHTTLIKKWDICAGNAILNATGGKMTTLSGQPINYSGSSDPKNEGGLVAALKNHENYLKKLGYA